MTILWFLMLVFTIMPYTIGISIPINNKINMSYITTPLVIISLVNSAVWLSVYIVFHLVVNRVIEYQKRLIVNNKINNKFTPMVSIIIPARNEGNVIKKTILNCLKQTYENIEIIIVCHNSKDNTYEEAKNVSDNRVKVFDYVTTEAGKGIALNYGIDNSKGEFICIIDSDGKS